MLFFIFFADDSNELGFTAFLLTALSVFLILVTVPFSLCLVIKVSSVFQVVFIVVW